MEIQKLKINQTARIDIRVKRIRQRLEDLTDPTIHPDGERFYLTQTEIEDIYRLSLGMEGCLSRYGASRS